MVAGSATAPLGYACSRACRSRPAVARMARATPDGGFAAAVARAPGRPIPPERLHDEAAQLEARQRAQHRRARLPGRRDELVHGSPPRHQGGGHLALRRRQRGEHHGSSPRGARHVGRRRTPSCAALPGGLGRLLEQSQVLDELPDAGHDAGLRSGLAQEGQAAGHRGIVEAPGHDVQASPLLERPGGGGEGAAARPGLDDDGGVREAADDPVPARKRAPARHGLGRELADHRAALLDDRASEPPMGRRVQAQVAAADDGDRGAAAAERRGVRGRIDPERKARDHGRAEDRDRVGDAPARRASHGGRSPGADDRDRAPPVQSGRVARDVQHRWRQLDAPQPRGIVRIREGHGADARAIEGRDRRPRVARHLRDGIGDRPRQGRRRRRRARPTRRPGPSRRAGAGPPRARRAPRRTPRSAGRTTPARRR